MKPVNVQTVRDRINLLETAQAETGLLSLAGEFELECLRKLLASMTAPALPVKVPDERFCPAEYQGSQLWTETEIWNKCISEVLRLNGISDLDAKRIAFITSLADDTAPQQFQSLATSAADTKPEPVVVIPSIWKLYSGAKVAGIYEQAMDEAGVKWRSVDDKPSTSAGSGKHGQ